MEKTLLTLGSIALLAGYSYLSRPPTEQPETVATSVVKSPAFTAVKYEPIASGHTELSFLTKKDKSPSYSSYFLSKYKDGTMPKLSKAQVVSVLCGSGKSLSAEFDKVPNAYFVDRGFSYPVAQTMSSSTVLSLRNLKEESETEFWVKGIGFGMDETSTVLVSTGLACKLGNGSARGVEELGQLRSANVGSGPSVYSASGVSPAPGVVLKMSAPASIDQVGAIGMYGIRWLSSGISYKTDVASEMSIRKASEASVELPSHLFKPLNSQSILGLSSLLAEHTRLREEKVRKGLDAQIALEKKPAYKLTVLPAIKGSPSTTATKESSTSSTGLAENAKVGSGTTAPAVKEVIKYVPDPETAKRVQDLSEAVKAMQVKMLALEQENSALKSALASKPPAVAVVKVPTPQVNNVAGGVPLTPPTVLVKKREVVVNENISAN